MGMPTDQALLAAFPRVVAWTSKSFAQEQCEALIERSHVLGKYLAELGVAGYPIVETLGEASATFHSAEGFENIERGNSLHGRSRWIVGYWTAEILSGHAGSVVAADAPFPF
jgi:hypothetical protein